MVSDSGQLVSRLFRLAWWIAAVVPGLLVVVAAVKILGRAAR
jgi:hypothetical protein